MAAASLLAGLVATGAPGAVTSARAAAIGVPELTSTLITDLNAVGCGDATHCVAVGGGQSTVDVVPITSGIPGTPHPVAGVVRLDGVGCWSSTDCLAVGSATNGGGVVVPISSGIPGAVKPVAGTARLSAISCPGAGLCVAAGDNWSTTGDAGIVLSITDGVVPSPLTVDGVASLSGIGCGAVDDCMVAGIAYPYVGDALVDIHSDIPGTAKLLVPGTSSLSCSAAGDCVGVNGGEVLPISGGVAGVQESVQPVGLTGVSCLSDGACLGVGGQSSLPIENGVPMPAQPIAADLSAVACLPSGCVAVGSASGQSAGAVVTLATPPPPSGQTPPALPVINPADITSFSWQSSPGDMVGGGTSGIYTPADTHFATGGKFSGLPTLSAFGVSVHGPGNDLWGVSVAAPVGQQLKEGVTYSATGQPYFYSFDPSMMDGPGLWVQHINYTDCAPGNVGSFTLGDLRTDADGVIQEFSLHFTQYCDQTHAAPLTGTIDFNIPRPAGSAPPVATPHPVSKSGPSPAATLAPSASTPATGPSAPGTQVGVATGSTPPPAPSTLPDRGAARSTPAPSTTAPVPSPSTSATGQIATFPAGTVVGASSLVAPGIALLATNDPTNAMAVSAGAALALGVVALLGEGARRKAARGDRRS